MLTPTNVNSSQFGKLYSVAVDGQVYTQPLYVSNLAIPGQGTHNVVYIATMNNSVYALDADTGKQYWKANFGPPVHPCDVEWHNNITHGSSVGILGTPVIDPSTNTIYFVSRNETNYNPSLCNWNSSAAPTGVNQGVFTQSLNALDITTGAPKFGSPVKITATYTTSDGTLTFNPQIQNQRTALTLANGDVYIAWASHDDLEKYHGWIISYKAETLAQDHVYSDTTSGTLGGIWQAGQGLTIDGEGNILVSTGNGSFGASVSGVIQTGNSFAKLSPSLQLLDYFTPSNSAVLNSGDQDLGSSGLLSIPGTTLVTGGGKQGRLYLVNTDHMGHFNASNDEVQQEFQAIFGNGTQHIHGTPIYFNSQNAGPIIYVWGENDFLRAYSFDSSTQLINTTPIAMSTMTAPMTNNQSAMPGGFLSLSANGQANGIIWASTPFKGDASQSTTEGVLHAFDAITLKELWNDKENEPRDEIGNFAKYVPPTVANGKLFVPSFGALNAADGSGSLNVYGLLPNGTGPTNLLANGTYVIKSLHSGLALDDPGSSTADGEVIEQNAVNGGKDESWLLTNLGSNQVSLVNALSGLALEAAGGSTAKGAFVDQNTYAGDAWQQWNVLSVSSGVYELTNVQSGYALDVDGGVSTAGAKIDQYPYQEKPWQQWSFTSSSGTSTAALIANGTYSLKSVNSGLVIDDPGYSTTAGEVMQQYAAKGGKNQSWVLKNLGSNIISLINESSGLALEVTGSSVANSALVDQNSYASSPSQQWRVVSAGSGIYELLNVHSGQALDVDGGVKTSGAEIDQFPYEEKAWQQWSFVP
ncbi:outer membrane protein assembly factor BamB [Silvibacterium bohemicum]|uniref:Outer membrane protein assembly factor BamB n=1 Tax=Silvibacterium bohemicum TaxID=1577686 RepID=A0A841JUS6_9BACT|nr:RICIN domain-containing protein [Silvibacterium bohemicum]MBB6145143.1 outer membrane protein assembly factor BamB [Silvibacterium bohemicum]